jgi:hypothetical protein
MASGSLGIMDWGTMLAQYHSRRWIIKVPDLEAAKQALGRLPGRLLLTWRALHLQTLRRHA